MKLKIINSCSKGNAYILETEKEALLLECGVGFPLIKKALNFDISKVVGCLVTHEHKDHSKSAKEVMKAGIDVYASGGTFSKTDFLIHRARVVKSLEKFKVGHFTVLPFDVKHDAEEPLGFLINHPDSGNILFLTDTFYSPYKFKNLNNIIIEANYSEEILEQRSESGSLHGLIRNRVLTSHLSIETCEKLLLANDLSKVNNIVLIHLSDGNSDEKEFIRQIQSATNKNVCVARPNMEINFNKTPF